MRGLDHRLIITSLESNFITSNRKQILQYVYIIQLHFLKSSQQPLYTYIYMPQNDTTYMFRYPLGTITMSSVAMLITYFWQKYCFITLQYPLCEITKACMSLRFASYHSMSWLTGIVDIAMPGKSVIFSGGKKKIEPPTATKTMMRESTKRLCQVGFSFVAHTRIHKLLETY